MRFKVGDKVRLNDKHLAKMKRDCGCWSSNRPDPAFLIVVEIRTDNTFSWSAHRDDGSLIERCYGHDLTDNDFELISANKQNMNVKESFKQLFLKEPQKTFQKLGITDISNQLTSDGTSIFLSWLLEKSQDTFKTEVCDPIVSAEKTE